MVGGWVYIMTNRPNGVLNTGVTSDIGRRAYEHCEGLVPRFTKRYGWKRLVYMGVTGVSLTRSSGNRT
jgi:putative endonuclease